LDAHGARIDGGIDLYNHFNLSGKLDLRTASAATYRDDQPSWPQANKLFLDGFVYERFEGSSPTTHKSRIDWLHLQDPGYFLPQPYEQLAKVLRNMGRGEEATEIMIQKNRDYGDSLPWYSPLRFWYGFIGEAIGFGYKTWNALWISLGFVLVGTLLFRIGYRRHLIEATDERAYELKSGARFVKTSYPKFNSLIYSLETFVPLVKLGVGDYWLPSAAAGDELPRWGFRIRPGSVLRGYYWVHILAGWVLTTLWVAGFTGLVKT